MLDFKYFKYKHIKVQGLQLKYQPHHKQQQIMILRKLNQNMGRSLLTNPYYNESRFQKFLFIIRRILNKMANEENRSFKQPIQTKTNPNLPQSQQIVPKSVQQALKLSEENQKGIMIHEKSRLARIDDILGTKTYFHQTKIYEHRVSNDNIVTVKFLKDKHKEISRQQLDILNPQIGLLQKLTKTRKYKKSLKNLKKYPTGNKNLTEFEEKHILKSGDQADTNASLIKFLSEEELFVRIALSDLSLTMQSIQTQKIEQIKDNQLINLQFQQQQFIHNEQIYFRPVNTMSIYRIDIKNYDRKLKTHIDSLTEAIAGKIGNIQEVINLDEIYQCLQSYYYDQRVGEYLGKVQNQEIQYFFTGLQVSPDGNGVFVVIDLLDNMKEFVGLYKQLSPTREESSIRVENVLFNFKPEVALRNDGILYYIQRSQQGLYTEFTKTKFNTKISSKPTKKQLQESTEQFNKIQKQSRHDRILYQCKPYHQLRIISNSEAKVTASGKHFMSNNVLLEENQMGALVGNRVYLVRHQGEVGDTGEKGDIQEITANNDRLKDLLREIGLYLGDGEGKFEVNAKKVYTQCHEIMGVGYLLVRYVFVSQQTGVRLKYGQNKKYANYVTFVPYASYNSAQTIAEQNIKIEDHSKRQEYIEGSSSEKKQGIKEEDASLAGKERPRIYEINLPSQQAGLLTDFTNQSKQFYQLEVQKEKLIYLSPEGNYITNLQVRHGSISNVYLLINNSIQSVYNRNSLYVHSLRKNVQPYSIYLDGFPIEIQKKNIGSGVIGKFNLKLLAPLLPVNAQYTLWKRQLKQIINNRIYTETINIRENQEDELVIKIITNANYVSRKNLKKSQVQPVILYLPSQNERLDQIVVQKLLQKGVMMIQIVKCRGIFGSTMIELLRGSKQFYMNYIDDIYDTIMFIRENISHHIGIYAQGPSSCFATLLLNIRENQLNQLFDCSVLHQGFYDTNNIDSRAEFFFGKDPSIFKDQNPLDFGMMDPSKSHQEESKQLIFNLSNILFSSLEQNTRAQSRKFVNKLRSHNKIIYDTVFLKQFDKKQDKDMFNLSYLYKVLTQKLRAEHDQTYKQKMASITEQGEANSRHFKDVQRQMDRKFKSEKQ